MKGPEISPMPRFTLGSADAGRLASALWEAAEVEGRCDHARGDGGPARIAGMPIIRLLGAGGMGEVYEAEQAAPQRRIALKLLRPGLPIGAAEGLQREIQILGRLEHPGIARIYMAGDACVDGVERPWLAMELVEGRTITAHVRAKAMPLQRRLELIRAVCAAVQHAHDHGVIHLDLKPSNVMVDRRGEVRVLDFGIARVLGSGAPSVRAGTPGFAAPEQLAGDDADERADVYGLGALLDAVTRDVPKRGCDQLEAVIAKATAPAPAARYAAPRDLEEDLGRLMLHRPVRAQRAPARLRGRLLLRRRRAPFALGGAAVLAATTAVWLLQGATQRADETAAALRASETQRQTAEMEVGRVSAVAEGQRRAADSQAALARLSAELLEMSSVTQTEPRATATRLTGDTMRLELSEGRPLETAALADIIRLQSALLADPDNESLRQELQQRAMALIAGDLQFAAPPDGARSLRVEHSSRWTETINLAPDPAPDR